MTAAIADRDPRRSDGRLKRLPLAAGVRVYKGTLVGVNSGGYLVPMSDTAGLLFTGVALEGADNTGGAAGAVHARVQKDGEFELAYSGGDASQAKVGQTVFCQDDQSVDEDAALTTNDYSVGIIVEVISGALVRVRIDNYTR